jgi:hypothetical protein
MAKKDENKRKNKKKGRSKGNSGPFDVWNNKIIQLPFTWENGDENLKGDPEPGTFELRPKKVPDGNGGTAVRFRLHFCDGKLPVYWKYVVLSPMGSKTPAKIDPLLPPIEELDPEKIQELLADLIDEMNVEDTELKRLEGYIPVLDGSDAAALDEVRMVYLKKAMENRQKPSEPRDFVLVNFRAPGQEPNGGGSGPPDG